MNLFLYGYELANSFLLFRVHKCFLQMIKIFFSEAQITFFASFFAEYFPLHVKGSAGIFEGPHPLGQFRLVSSVRVSEGCQVISVLFFEVSGY